MAINEQIGGSQEAKLLQAISKQLDRLKGVASKLASGGGGGDGSGDTSVWTEEVWQEAYNSYVHPPEFLPLPPVNIGEEKVVILNAVYDHDSNFCAFTATGSNGYTVNWGDGTSNNYASGVKAEHIYDFNYAGFAGTITSLGYKQSIITITPQAGGNLLTLAFNIRHNSNSPASIYSTGYLDIKVAGVNFTSILFGVQFGQQVYSSNLKRFEFIGTNNITSTNYMFGSCISLGKIVSFDVSKVTAAAGMFSDCTSLPTVPLLNFTPVIFTNLGSMFTNCASLITVPLFDTGSCIFFSSMFSNCRKLLNVPFFNLNSATATGSMFSSCASLVTVPLFNLSNVTNASSMFSSCTSLTSLPLFNLINVGNGMNMFGGCASLTTVPLFNLSNLSNGSGMFSGCTKLTSVPLFNIGSLLTTTSSMFSSCPLLTSVPLLNLSSVTDASSMFSSCTSLISVSLFNLSNVTNISNMFMSCKSLVNIPAYNLSAVTTATNSFYDCASDSKFLPIGLKNSFDITNNKLSKSSLELMFNNISSNVTSKTVTITGNYGADTTLSRAGSGTAVGSATVTQVNTTGLLVGMRVTGTGIDTARAVTFQDTGDTVTLVSHNFPNGMRISFPTIVTTTGIIVKTPYYVVNATADTFQVSLTNGGAPLALTTNGTGTAYIPTYITSINPGINFTIDKPASATGTVTLLMRLLDTSIAIMKGWTVTG